MVYAFGFRFGVLGSRVQASGFRPLQPPAVVLGFLQFKGQDLGFRA